jgi:hypothetical protein
MLKLCVFAAIGGVSASHGSPWDPKFTTLAQATLAKMSNAQKFTMIHGSPGGYVGNVPPITLSDGTVIPPINLEDGPQGVADGVGSVTAWPSALTVVQSWDPSMMYKYGSAMGREQWLKGTNVMLGPGVNLARIPWCGRNLCVVGAIAARLALLMQSRPSLTPHCTPPPCALHGAAAVSTRARTPCWPPRWWLLRSWAFKPTTSAPV